MLACMISFTVPFQSTSGHQSEVRELMWPVVQTTVDRQTKMHSKAEGNADIYAGNVILVKLL